MKNSPTENVVTTTYASFRGIPSEQDNHVLCFRGIRYARADRFSYGVPEEDFVHGEPSLLDAVSYGACCYQKRAFYDASEKPKDSTDYFYWNEFRRDETYTYSDDCLFLNIWTPKEHSGKCPVLFFIHGGGFTDGCGHEKPMRGEAWARRGVILVTFNYRVGPFGLLCSPLQKDREGYTGNLGLYDQYLAFHWVKHHIASFGGDPENITIMGQSAGAISVQQMMGSPLYKECSYAKSISLSLGGATRLLNTGSRRPEDNYGFWKEVVDRAVGDSGDSMREQGRSVHADNQDIFTCDPKRIVDGFLSVSAKDLLSVFNTMPVQDGRIVTHSSVDIMKNNLFYKCPGIVSTTSEDLAAPILKKMARSWTKNMHKNNLFCAREYFSRKLPGDEKGAFHSADLWYVFGSLSSCWRPFTKEDEDISCTLMDAYEEFMRTGHCKEVDMPGLYLSAR